MITNHELQAVIDETAQDIAQVEDDPVNWGPWVFYVLEALEQIATDKRQKDEFERMLKKLGFDIANRVNLGSWGL